MSLSYPQFCDTCGAANRTQALFCKVCGHPLRTPTTNTFSSTLTGLLNHQVVLKQRYIILSPAGHGGFGAVYKALDTLFGSRQVAIKEMSQRNLAPYELQQASEAFRHEALLLSGLTHPNLPRIYDQFTDMGRSYLVMDFIEGETLEKHINSQAGKKMSIEKVLDVGIQLCSVLDFLHTRQPPIIFRDLKPANVMLTVSGHIYLIDFGIARHFKPGQITDTAALGSSGYAPPEQYGKSQTTAQADIYSLGATLHHMLSGDNPVESPFNFAPLNLHRQPALAGLETLVMTMVNIDINKRPANVLIVKQELQHIETQYISGQTYSLPYGTSIHQIPRSSTQSMRNTRRPKQADLPQLRPQMNTQYICLGHSSRVTAVAWSPDSQHLASASYDKTIQIWDATNGKSLLTYRGHFLRVNDLAWSPDSTLLASASDDGTVQIWNTITGGLVYTYHGHTGHVNAVTWSPDKLRIASAGDDKTVQVWHASQHTLLSTYNGHTDKIHTLAWSPDGKQIASGGKDRKVQIWDAMKDQQKRSFLTSLLFPHQGQRTLNSHYGQICELAWSPDGKHLASASNDHRVLVWDVHTGMIVFSQGANSSDIKNAVAWSPANKHIAIGCNDKTVQIWNTVSKSSTFIYHGHTGYVMTVAWSPDGTRIASGGVDRTVQVWQPM